MKYPTLTITSVVLALALSACGGSSTATSPQAAASATTHAAGVALASNPADVTFAQGMIPHHEQAIEMADIALDPAIGAGDAIKQLATRIKTAQDPEVTTMKGWLTSWGEPMMTDMSGDQMDAMGGMMSTAEMDALGALTGAEFDHQWATMMIAHHEGAIAMAQTVKATGSSADVRTLADAVVAVQQAEITELKALAGA